MNVSRWYWGVLLLALTLLVVLTPSYLSLASASNEVRQLKKQIRQMTYTITITWPDSTTTVYYDCTNYVRSDNGTVSFTGKKGSDTAPEGDYVIGHGQYTEIEKIVNT